MCKSLSAIVPILMDTSTGKMGCTSILGIKASAEKIKGVAYKNINVNGTCNRSINVHIISDMIRRRNLRTRSIKMLVLDEADEMLNKGKKKKRNDVASPSFNE